ncbi:hypothetical protein J3R30DRAFT_1777434 [Lentinula aciculospora]|uniref:Multifunctional methyltransferase subunit TRM112-like protein n=1 Tax=Lentinula aciculospora TaxID=153920 RepID=A0A9W9ALJ7_9AGAR|nr:hypothetical protein J3R30DRAFT_1777434 [Lentinula aciculospora]
MVRLITHNLLACHVKGCTSNNFPLQFQDVQIELREADYNADFLKAFLPKLEWKALVDSARKLGDTSLPLEQPEMLDNDFLKNLHHVLLEVLSNRRYHLQLLDESPPRYMSRKGV